MTELTKSQDTGSQDTGSQDTGSQDTGSQDTRSQDTRSQDTGSQDTRSQDTRSQDINFVDSLPEKYRSHERFKGMESMDDLVKAHAELKASPEVPQAADYELPEGIPEEFGKWAVDNNMTQTQVDAMFELKAGMDGASQQAIQTHYQEGLTELYTSWGDKHQENLNLAQRALQFIDGEGTELQDMLNMSGEGNNPILVKKLAGLGQILKEGKFIKNSIIHPSSRPSDAEVMYPDQGR